MSAEQKTNKLEKLGEESAKESPSSQILEKPRRRSFSRAYKLKILEKLDLAKSERGSVGKLLRCEGLYTSQVAKWRQELEGSLGQAFTKKRGPKPNPAVEERKMLEKAERKIQKLERELEEAKLIIDIQKKLSVLMGIKLPETTNTEAKD